MDGPRSVVGPYLSLGSVVRQVRKQKGLTNAALAKKTHMRPAQLSAVENGANVEIQFYDKAALGLGFRNALELFRSGGDVQTRKLLRLWELLRDVEARNDVLRQAKDVLDRHVESDATEGEAWSGGMTPERGRKGK